MNIVFIIKVSIYFDSLNVHMGPSNYVRYQA